MEINFFTIFYQRMLAIYLKYYHDTMQSDTKKCYIAEPEEKWDKRSKNRKKNKNGYYFKSQNMHKFNFEKMKIEKPISFPILNNNNNKIESSVKDHF